VTAPTRPVLRWHGGKWRLAPWIISHFPPHRVYVEPFGGAASVLLRKPRSHVEVYNDLDGEAVNLFRVLRDREAAVRLVELLALTPFAREEFLASYSLTGDPVEDARRFVARSFMGFGSNAACTTLNGRAQTGFRSNSNRSGTVPAREWTGLPHALYATVERLRGVIVENRDACDVMAAHDEERALHYVDPPYLHALRSPANPSDLKHFYRHELTDGQHGALLDFLRSLDGMVVLSGYPSPFYDDALPGWRKATVAALADGARERTEVLWINPACADALDRRAAGACTPLFARVP
jgi:DNA adenine methylase